jgi:addiction module HigA family antidote
MAMKHPPHPGGLVGDEIGALGLTVETAATGLGVKHQDLAALIRGETPISPEMAFRLEKAVGSSADLWLRLQVAYDLAQVRDREAEIVVTRLASALAL